MWTGDGATEEGSVSRAAERTVEGESHEIPWRDPAQLGELLRRLEPRMRAVALRYMRDPETAQDVVQNAFEKVVRHAHRFRGGSKPSTWMHRIVANEALMALRSERRQSRRRASVEDWDALPLQDPAPDAPEMLDVATSRARVRDALSTLREDEREVLVECAIDGRSYAEYGHEAGLHPAAVKSRAFRARRRLRALLEPLEVSSDGASRAKR